MSMDKQPSPPKPFERVMLFIDGGYLRELCKKYYGHDSINFDGLRQLLIGNFNLSEHNSFQANLIKTYYYDAIVAESHKDYPTQKAYFSAIDLLPFYTVRLGRLVESSKKGFKQKGVDVLMVIDALTKAYQNQYEAGMFFVGDRDFVPLIEAVKNAGKKTVGIYHKPTCSVDLLPCFDWRIRFRKTEIEFWMKKRKAENT